MSISPNNVIKPSEIHLVLEMPGKKNEPEMSLTLQKVYRAVAILLVVIGITMLIGAVAATGFGAVLLPAVAGVTLFSAGTPLTMCAVTALLTGTSLLSKAEKRSHANFKFTKLTTPSDYCAE